jgi:hypothetical protein
MPRISYSRGLSLLFAAVVSAVFSSAALAADNYSVRELKEAAPEGLAPGVRDALSKSGYRVVSGDKIICDVWFHAQLPVIEKFVPQNDVEYPIEPGTLIGAIRFPRATTDYRQQSIKPGAFTLRYGQQPQDGNHIGTAQYRDFAIAIQAGDDPTPGKLSQEKAMDLSKKATGSIHPAIFSMLPPQKGREVVPTMAHMSELKLEVLVTKVTAKGDAAKDLQVELVVVGHAPE